MSAFNPNGFHANLDPRLWASHNPYLFPRSNPEVTALNDVQPEHHRKSNKAGDVSANALPSSVRPTLPDRPFNRESPPMSAFTPNGFHANLDPRLYASHNTYLFPRSNPGVTALNDVQPEHHRKSNEAGDVSANALPSSVQPTLPDRVERDNAQDTVEDGPYATFLSHCREELSQTDYGSFIVLWRLFRRGGFETAEEFILLANPHLHHIPEFVIWLQTCVDHMLGDLAPAAPRQYSNSEKIALLRLFAQDVGLHGLNFDIIAKQHNTQLWPNNPGPRSAKAIRGQYGVSERAQIPTEVMMYRQRRAGGQRGAGEGVDRPETSLNNSHWSTLEQIALLKICIDLPASTPAELFESYIQRHGSSRSMPAVERQHYRLVSKDPMIPKHDRRRDGPPTADFFRRKAAAISAKIARLEQIAEAEEATAQAMPALGASATVRQSDVQPDGSAIGRGVKWTVSERIGLLKLVRDHPGASSHGIARLHNQQFATQRSPQSINSQVNSLVSDDNHSVLRGNAWTYAEKVHLLRVCLALEQLPDGHVKYPMERRTDMHNAGFWPANPIHRSVRSVEVQFKALTEEGNDIPTTITHLLEEEQLIAELKGVSLAMLPSRRVHDEPRAQQGLMTSFVEPKTSRLGAVADAGGGPLPRKTTSEEGERHSSTAIVQDPLITPTSEPEKSRAPTSEPEKSRAQRGLITSFFKPKTSRAPADVGGGPLPRKTTSEERALITSFFKPRTSRALADAEGGPLPRKTTSEEGERHPSTAIVQDPLIIPTSEPEKSRAQRGLITSFFKPKTSRAPADVGECPLPRKTISEERALITSFFKPRTSRALADAGGRPLPRETTSETISEEGQRHPPTAIARDPLITPTSEPKNGTSLRRKSTADDEHLPPTSERKKGRSLRRKSKADDEYLPPTSEPKDGRSLRRKSTADGEYLPPTKKRRRAASAKSSTTPNYCPPTGSLDFVTFPDLVIPSAFPSPPFDLSNDPGRHSLHPQEIRLASHLRLTCDEYVRAKLLIFHAKVIALRQGTDFDSSHARDAVDVSKVVADALFDSFDGAGWFDAAWFESFL